MSSAIGINFTSTNWQNKLQTLLLKLAKRLGRNSISTLYKFGAPTNVMSQPTDLSKVFLCCDCKLPMFLAASPNWHLFKIDKFQCLECLGKEVSLK